MQKPKTMIVYPVETPHHAVMEYDGGQFVIEVHETTDPKSAVYRRALGATEAEALEDLKEKGFKSRNFTGPTAHMPNFNFVADCSYPAPVLVADDDG